MVRFQSLLSRFGFGADRRRVRAMQLDPAELGEQNWKVLKERIWTSRVIVDSSTDSEHTPISTMATRQFGAEADALVGVWTHIIPLPSKAQAEALSGTLLHRIRPNPDSQVTEMDERQPEGIDLLGTSSVRALEKDTVGLGLTGRVLWVVACRRSSEFALFAHRNSR
jgi:hypothetical protein